MQAAPLPDRGVVKVDGADARRFLNGLLTTDIEKADPTSARFAALLTPQGKILFDGIVVVAPAEDGGGFFIDRKSTRLNSSHIQKSRMPSSA